MIPEAYKALDGADIVCSFVPDNWIFVDGHLTKWDAFLTSLFKGELTFSSLKVGVRRFAYLSSLLEKT